MDDLMQIISPEMLTDMRELPLNYCRRVAMLRTVNPCANASALFVQNTRGHRYSVETNLAHIFPVDVCDMDAHSYTTMASQESG